MYDVVESTIPHYETSWARPTHPPLSRGPCQRGKPAAAANGGGAPSCARLFVGTLSKVRNLVKNGMRCDPSLENFTSGNNTWGENFFLGITWEQNSIFLKECVALGDAPRLAS